MEYLDKPLTCAECGQQFIFTAGEQEFYDRKGFKEIPKRCRPCREARKTRGPGGNSRGAGDGGPREERAPRTGDGGGRGGSGRGSGSGSGRELFDAVCASCGKPARVPFKPATGRPVYCRECYSTKRGEGE